VDHLLFNSTAEHYCGIRGIKPRLGIGPIVVRMRMLMLGRSCSIASSNEDIHWSLLAFHGLIVCVMPCAGRGRCSTRRSSRGGCVLRRCPAPALCIGIALERSLATHAKRRQARPVTSSVIHQSQNSVGCSPLAVQHRIVGIAAAVPSVDKRLAFF
jgi:hypothetical protein